jgi:hypothetical protein
MYLAYRGGSWSVLNVTYFEHVVGHSECSLSIWLALSSCQVRLIAILNIR